MNYDTALITSEDFKSYYGILSSSTGSDSLIALLIEKCSSLISEFCERKFQSASYTEYFDGRGKSDLFVTHYPIASPLSATTGGGLWDDPQRTYSDSYKLTEDVGQGTGDFVVYPSEEGQGKISRINGVFYVGRRNIKITYTGGYTQIPRQIQLACFRMVSNEYQKTQKDTFGQSSQSIHRDSTTYIAPKDVPLDIREMLERWRKWSFR